MSGATDTYCLLSQPRQAILGGPTIFLLTITNTSASTAYTVSSVDVWATNQQGAPSASARLTQPRFPPNSTTDVAASGTLPLHFDGAFFGQAVGGIPSAAGENFLVAAQVTYSDGSVVAAPALPVSVADPLFGAGSSPPGPSFVTGGLQFYASANSGLHLLGWV